MIVYTTVYGRSILGNIRTKDLYVWKTREEVTCYIIQNYPDIDAYILEVDIPSWDTSTTCEGTKQTCFKENYMCIRKYKHTEQITRLELLLD